MVALLPLKPVKKSPQQVRAKNTGSNVSNVVLNT
jgi:hypothetical protein